MDGARLQAAGANAAQIESTIESVARISKAISPRLFPWTLTAWSTPTITASFSPLVQQAHKQQDAFQALARESWDAYLGFMRAPFSYYQRAFDTAQTTMREGVEDFKKAADQGVENLQKETRSTEKAAQKASR